MTKKELMQKFTQLSINDGLNAISDMLIEKGLRKSEEAHYNNLFKYVMNLRMNGASNFRCAEVLTNWVLLNIY